METFPQAYSGGSQYTPPPPDSKLPIVVMTAWGSVESAVEAMRRGAGDYIEKPWDNQRLISILRTQIELGRALRRTERLESENRMLRRDGLPEMIARSVRWRRFSRSWSGSVPPTRTC